ncbi:Arc family DNA-binding protein [Anaeromassilibacillus senegalensis]|uniref:Arc family DNA-binding protein n=1 Tax=Anaeromassilibacillus senegalensis TaxID=1673717 RepID=UPI0009E4847F|nr:Arc family DNA-binding protein [Anaeromassilibacillus senegalensis]
MSANDGFTKETDKRFTLRMEIDLFERISTSAKAHRRSVAKEIEQAVEFYLNANGEF